MPVVCVAQDVNARSGRRVPADPLADTPPALVAIFDNQRLFDEPAGEIARRTANPEDLEHETRVVGRRAHFGEAGDQPVAEER